MRRSDTEPFEAVLTFTLGTRTMSYRVAGASLAAVLEKWPKVVTAAEADLAAGQPLEPVPPSLPFGD